MRSLAIHISIILIVLWGNSSSASLSEEKQAEFEGRLSIIESLYGEQILHKFKTPLQLQTMWTKRNLVFEASVDNQGHPNIIIGGGALLLPFYTPDLFTLIVCHEIGHLIGGAPYKVEHSYASSVEGQADYFAAKCAFNVFQYVELVPNEVDSKENSLCRDTYTNPSDQIACQRVIQTIEKYAKDSYSMKQAWDELDQSTTQVEQTLNQRPSLVCQLTTFLASIGNLSRPSCWYKNEVQLFGKTPSFEFPKLKDQANNIWSFWKNRLNLSSSIVAPEIYFYLFDKNDQGQMFNQWQRTWLFGNLEIWQDWAKLKKEDEGTEYSISQNWVEENIDNHFPFPNTFLAFHYDGTNRIQMNPQRTMLSSYQNDPYGIKRDLLGAGFYGMAHEMLHYSLQEILDIPSRLHHCLFVTPVSSTGKPLILEMAEHIVQQKYSAPAMTKMGPESETRLSPCDFLNGDDLELVRQTAAQL